MNETERRKLIEALRQLALSQFKTTQLLTDILRRLEICEATLARIEGREK